MDHGQTKPGALTGPLRREEWLEQPGPNRVRDPGAIIVHHEPDASAGQRLRPHPHLPAVMRRLDGVAHEVHERRLQATTVREQSHRRRRLHDPQLHAPGYRLIPDRARRRHHHRPRAHLLAIAGLPGAELQQLPDDTLHAPHLPADRRRHSVRIAAARKTLRHPVHYGQRRAQLMGDPARKAPDRRQLLAPPQLVLQVRLATSPRLHLLFRAAYAQHHPVERPGHLRHLPWAPLLHQTIPSTPLHPRHRLRQPTNVPPDGAVVRRQDQHRRQHPHHPEHTRHLQANPAHRLLDVAVPTRHLHHPLDPSAGTRQRNEIRVYPPTARLPVHPLPLRLQPPARARPHILPTTPPTHADLRHHLTRRVVDRCTVQPADLERRFQRFVQLLRTTLRQRPAQRDLDRLRHQRHVIFQTLLHRPLHHHTAHVHRAYAQNRQRPEHGRGEERSDPHTRSVPWCLMCHFYTN